MGKAPPRCRRGTDVTSAKQRRRGVQLDVLQNNVAADAVISLYRCGPMVDLCRGPHVPNTSYIKALTVTNSSRAFWRGDTTKDGLQRVYGVTFPDKKKLKGAATPSGQRHLSLCAHACPAVVSTLSLSLTA